MTEVTWGQNMAVVQDGMDANTVWTSGRWPEAESSARNGQRLTGVMCVRKWKGMELSAREQAIGRAENVEMEGEG